MLIARWQVRAAFGRTEEVVALLRKWEVDVGQRIGWRTGSVRIAHGSIGLAANEIELEVRIDNLTDLESAWNDMDKVPYHAEYLKQLAPLLEAGSKGWTVLKEVDLVS